MLVIIKNISKVLKGYGQAITLAKIKAREVGKQMNGIEILKVEFSGFVKSVSHSNPSCKKW